MRPRPGTAGQGARPARVRPGRGARPAQVRGRPYRIGMTGSGVSGIRKWTPGLGARVRVRGRPRQPQQPSGRRAPAKPGINRREAGKPGVLGQPLAPGQRAAACSPRWRGRRSIARNLRPKTGLSALSLNVTHLMSYSVMAPDRAAPGPGYSGGGGSRGPGWGGARDPHTGLGRGCGPGHGEPAAGIAPCSGFRGGRTGRGFRCGDLGPGPCLRAAGRPCGGGSGRAAPLSHDRRTSERAARTSAEPRHAAGPGMSSSAARRPPGGHARART